MVLKQYPWLCRGIPDFHLRHGNLQQFVDDQDLYIRVVGKIMTEFNIQQPPSAHAPQDLGTLGSEDTDGNNKWIRIFWGREHVGPAVLTTCFAKYGLLQGLSNFLRDGFRRDSTGLKPTLY